MCPISPICGHKINRIITVDGEVICGICGVVYGMKEQEATPLIPRINLYLEMEMGGKPNPKLPAERYIHEKSDLGVISNIAQKLHIPNHTSRDIWTWYRRFRGEKQISLTRSKTMVLVFYMVCRSHGIPINEKELMDAIRAHLGVRYVHPYLKCVMEASSFLDDTGEMIIKRMGFLSLADGSGGHSTMRSLGSPAVAEVARKILPVMDGGRARATRMAIRMARKRCGV